MSTRSELNPASTSQFGRFEIRDTFRGLSSWGLTFFAFASLVEISARFIQVQAHGAWLAFAPKALRCTKFYKEDNCLQIVLRI